MDKLEALIKKLEEIKEELNKAAGSISMVGALDKKEILELYKNGQWEIKKVSFNPKLAPKEVKVKELQQKIQAGTYKPDAGKIADAMLSHPEKPLKKEEKVNLNNPYNEQPKGSTAPKDGGDKNDKKPELATLNKTDSDSFEEFKKARASSSVFNAGTHPMKGKQFKTGSNIVHYEYDTSVPHEENMKQLQDHANKYKMNFRDQKHMESYLRQRKASAETEEM